jgi:hypothetical protein
MYILEKGLSFQGLVLVVQKKLDCLVSKIRLSGFHGFNPPPPRTELTPSPIISLFTPNLSRTTMRATPRPPLMIPWFLRGILEFLGEINSPRTGVYDSPTGFPLLKVFSPPRRSLCPMDGFGIPSMHCLHSCPSLSPCNISWNRWIN